MRAMDDDIRKQEFDAVIGYADLRHLIARGFEANGLKAAAGPWMPAGT